jgi:hypothetical protein
MTGQNMGYYFPDLAARAIAKLRTDHSKIAGTSKLSALEWSVVALARNDRLSTLRNPGRISMAMSCLFGFQHNPRLADPRLEALRRIAVLSWHRELAVHGSEVKAFVAAGFTLEQYELVVTSTRKVGSGPIGAPRG